MLSAPCSMLLGFMRAQGSVLIVAPAPPPYGGMALQGQTLCELLRREGVGVEFVSTNPKLRWPFSQIKGLRTLAESLVFLIYLCRGLRRAAVVHVLAASYLYFFLRVVPAVLLARLGGRRVIVNYRGGLAAPFFAAWGWMTQPILRLAHVIMVPSRFLERVFAEHGLRVQIIPNLVDLQHLSQESVSADDQASKMSEEESSQASKASCRRLSTSNHAPRLLVTRNLEPIYNVRMALEAFAIIKTKYPNSRLDIVGTGQEESALKNWVDGKRLKDVVFHGAVPNEQIPVFLKQADIFLNPSHADNMPISLLEAFACGVPVVSTRVGGIPDLVGEDKAALLVEPGNSAQMAEKIEEILTNPERAKRLTTYARDLCKAFTWEAIRDRLLTVYYPQNQEARRL